MKSNQTPEEVLSDKVYAAMETGNPAAAREVLAEYKFTLPAECERLRREVLVQYGIHL